MGAFDFCDVWHRSNRSVSTLMRGEPHIANSMLRIHLWIISSKVAFHCVSIQFDTSCRISPFSYRTGADVAHPGYRFQTQLSLENTYSTNWKYYQRFMQQHPECAAVMITFYQKLFIILMCCRLDNSNHHHDRPRTHHGK